MKAWVLPYSGSPSPIAPQERAARPAPRTVLHPRHCSATVLQVQVNVTFLKCPAWQVGVIRSEEEDTGRRVCLLMTVSCGLEQRS